MKTPKEIREEGRRSYMKLENKDVHHMPTYTLGYTDGFESSQSSMEEEIERRIQVKVNLILREAVKFDGTCASSQLEAIQNHYYAKGLKKAIEIIKEEEKKS
jgi:hypothetical protein